MTTCPRCGRDADDEFVCAECGAFLAADQDEGPAGDVPVRRVALIAVLVCLLAVGAAAVLLRRGDDKTSGAASGITPPVGLSNLPLGVPTGPTFPDDSSSSGSASASSASSSASRWR